MIWPVSWNANAAQLFRFHDTGQMLDNSFRGIVALLDIIEFYPQDLEHFHVSESGNGDHIGLDVAVRYTIRYGVGRRCCMFRPVIVLLFVIVTGCDSDAQGSGPIPLSCPEQYDLCVQSAGRAPSDIALCRCANDAKRCLGQDGGTCSP